jgi:hypothetical protein
MLSKTNKIYFIWLLVTVVPISERVVYCVEFKCGYVF